MYPSSRDTVVQKYGKRRPPKAFLVAKNASENAFSTDFAELHYRVRLGCRPGELFHLRFVIQSMVSLFYFTQPKFRGSRFCL